MVPTSGTTGASSTSGSSAVANEETKHGIQGMFGERTNEFQLLKLERKGRVGGHWDPWYLTRKQLSSSDHPGSMFPIDMQGNQKVEVKEFVSEHEIDLLNSTVGISRGHIGELENTHLPGLTCHICSY
jgi:hypothetical protein